MAKVNLKIFKNKAFLSILIIGVLIFGYFIYKNYKTNGEIQYIIGRVSKGKIEKTVSSSGYITIPDKLDIKPKISGEIVYVGVKENDPVKQGALLVVIDPTNYQKQVDDAQFSLQMAQLSLDKLNSQKEQTSNDLNKAYEDAFQHLSSIYGDLPTLMTSLKQLFETQTIQNNKLKDLDFYSRVVSFYRNIPYTENQQIDSFNEILNNYYNLFRRYQLLKLPLNHNDLDDFLNSSYYTIKNLFELIRTNRDIVSSYKDLEDNHSISTSIPLAVTASQLTTLQTAATSLNQSLNTLTSDKNIIEKYKTTLKNYEQDIENQKYIIKQKENALKEAKDNLNNCYLRAPFNGIVVNFNLKKGDLVTSNTTVLTLITENKIAEVTLSEIDAAAVKVGQKAILTFDALPGITLYGKVSEVGLIGETSQGVVLYPVKISFDSSPQLEKVKSGMTVDANIVVEEKSDILVVPSSAIKTKNNRSYVEVPQEADLNSIKSKISANKFKQALSKPVSLTLKPQEKYIQPGLSDDNNTEIISGLKEGDYIILKRITPLKKTTTVTTRANSLFTPQMRMPMR
jgi:HlyD family secretion protein